MDNQEVNRNENRNQNMTGSDKPEAPEAKIPKPGEKMDIPVPKRSGIIIGPEGPYRETYIPSPDSDAR